MNKARIFLRSLYQNNRFLGNEGLSKIRLFQSYKYFGFIEVNRTVLSPRPGLVYLKEIKGDRVREQKTGIHCILPLLI